MKIKRFSKSEYTQVAKLLLQEEVVGFPTETVYGLGVIFDSENAYHKLMNAKNRPEQKPFTLMCDSLETVKKFAYVDARIEKVLAHFFPGALTVILKAKSGIPYWVTMGSEKIGIRISSHPLVMKIINEVKKPLLVPSANKAGESPLTLWRDVEKKFSGEIAGLISENADGDLPSTIIEIHDIIKVVRQGSISLDEINRVWEEKM